MDHLPYFLSGSLITGLHVLGLDTKVFTKKTGYFSLRCYLRQPHFFTNHRQSRLEANQ